MATKVQLFTTCNPTPILGPNPLWVNDNLPPWGSDPDAKGNAKWVREFIGYDYVKDLGARDMFMVYDGTLNRAPLWCSDDLTLKADYATAGLDWTREGNYANPPQKLQLEMCMKLAQNADFFGAKVQSHLPVILDLENPSVGPDFYQDDQQASAIEKVNTMTQAVKWCKQWHWSNISPVGVYAWPPFLPITKTKNWLDPKNFDVSEVDEFANAIDYVAPSIYFWDVPALHPDVIFTHIDQITRMLDRYFSWLPRRMVITPTYQIYWPQNDPTGKAGPMNGKAIDLALWKRFIQYLVERSFDLVLWNPQTNVVGVKPLLQAMRKFIY